MRTLNFGIEIETIGQTRERVAQAIQQVVGGEIRHSPFPACYDTWQVTDRDGRRWKVMADSSLNAPKRLQAEIVSPILRYQDIPELQEIVRAVRRAGAKTNASCGVHIHVDAARFDARAVGNLVKIVNKQEELITQALGIEPGRLSRYCRGVNQEFLRKIEQQRPKSMDDLNRCWYGYYASQPARYHGSRYHALNLHSIWRLGTIEYRLFNSTLHAGKIKAYIQFVLALSAKALGARSARSARRAYNPATAKYDFRVFLLSLKLIGDEFKTARQHLLARLEGSAAWKHGRPKRSGQPAAAASAEPADEGPVRAAA